MSKIKQVQKFNYLDITVRDDWMSDTEIENGNIRRCFSETKQSINGLKNVMRNEEEWTTMLCNVSSL